jgi:hypothetical protein
VFIKGARLPSSPFRLRKASKAHGVGEKMICEKGIEKGADL